MFQAPQKQALQCTETTGSDFANVSFAAMTRKAVKIFRKRNALSIGPAAK